MSDDVLIRPIRAEDIAQVTAIYAHYVLTSAATFELEPPTTNEMDRRRIHIEMLGLPYLVAEIDGRIAGYAYASQYRPRKAYRFTVEDSIYLDPAFVGRRIGGVLLDRVIDRAMELGYRQMIAVIGGSNNLPSIRLHQRHGFTPAGLLKSAGFKFGQWEDSVLMRRALGAGDTTLPSD